MDGNFGEWLNLALRWAHLITGIAWIGSSFFFMWLDSHLEKPEVRREGVEGELWMVHGGGFYEVDKFMVAPATIPRTLHWFKWEAYFTWITGFLLLVLVYWMGAGVWMIDPQVADIDTTTAVGIGVGTLVLGWLVYDLLWASPLGRRAPAVLAVVCFLLFVAVAWGLSQFLGGRAAYLHAGAMLGTIMAANVWRRIIPSQRQLEAGTKGQGTPDPALAAAAKQRSVHNNYMTLPVLFVMISNHYPMTFGHQWNWAILAVVALAGAAIRHYFNLRNHGQGRRGLVFVAVAVALVLGLVFVTAPPRGDAAAGAGGPVAFAEVETVIRARCVTCHSATPTDEAFEVAPMNVMFDTAGQIARMAPRIRAVAVDTETMPLGNLTGMTAEERALVGRWIDEGAGTD